MLLKKKKKLAEPCARSRVGCWRKEDRELDLPRWQRRTMPRPGKRQSEISNSPTNGTYRDEKKSRIIIMAPVKYMLYEQQTTCVITKPDDKDLPSPKPQSEYTAEQVF